MTPSAPDPTPTDAPKPPEEAGALSMSIPTTQGEVKLTRSAQGASLEMPAGEISGSSA
jgi:hypothetical protein